MVFHIKVKLLIFLLNLFGINFYQKYSSYEYTKKGIFLQRSKDFCRIRCALKELDSDGFCGFWIHWELHNLGIYNIVVNPADVPTMGGERLRDSLTKDQTRHKK